MPVVRRYSTPRIEKQRLHKRTEREKKIRAWLRNTPLSERGWYRFFMPPTYDMKAPADMRFLVNTKECADFFAGLRKYADNDLSRSSLSIDLKDIEHIDFASTMLLNAIGNELADSSCNLRGNIPQRPTCHKYLKDSGFFNGKFKNNGRQYSNSSSSEFITIESGQEKLTMTHIQTIRDLVKHIHAHLGAEQPKNRRHTTLIKEICANSVEWSEANKKQWKLGAKFEDGKVIVVALDLGKGILESLYLTVWKYIEKVARFKNDSEILYGAFIEKYGSTSKEKNRNRGLPGIKTAFDEGFVKDLTVISNNGKINFNDGNNPEKFSFLRSAFAGTLYSFCIDVECVK